MEHLKEFIHPPLEQFPERKNSNLYSFTANEADSAHRVINSLHTNGVEDVKITNFYYNDSLDGNVIMRISNPDKFEQTVQSLNDLFAIQQTLPENYQLTPDTALDYVIPYLKEQWSQPATSPETGYFV